MKQRSKTNNNEYGKDHPAIKLLPVIIAFTGVVFMFAGITRGEMDVVLRKAITICLECIGIG